MKKVQKSHGILRDSEKVDFNFWLNVCSMPNSDSAKNCSTCHGKGTVLNPVKGTDFVSDKYYLDEECPACNGTGRKQSS